MSGSNRIRIILWMFLVIIKGAVVRGQTVGPNAVALIKGQTMLDCLTNLLAASSWTRTTDGTSNNPLLIATGCSVSGNNAAYYRTEQIGGNICRLIIANVTMQQAGVYTCFDGASTLYRSLVTVIDPVANVVVHNQSAEVVEGDQLNISCSINYNGPSSPAPSLRPSPHWTTSPEQIYINATYHPSTNVVTLMATVAVQKPTVPIFQCNTVFSITGNTSGYNATAPADSFTVGNTKELDVQYGPSAPTISHGTRSFTAKDGSICTLTTLTCTSTANPSPSYKWKDVTNGNQLIIGVSGNVFDWAEDNRTYECTTTNRIRNVNRSMSTVYTVGVSSSRPCVSVNSKDIRICSDDGRCDNEATPRSCSNSSHIYLTCNIRYVNPNPTRCQWADAKGNIVSNTSAYNATMDGDYTVLAYNEINQQTNTPAVANVRVTDCLSSTSLSTTTQWNIPSKSDVKVDYEAAKTAAIILGVLLGLSLIINGTFILIIIQRKRSKNRDQNTKTSTTRERNTWNQETVNPSLETLPPSTYQELSLNREQPTQYERLAADTQYVNVGNNNANTDQ